MEYYFCSNWDGEIKESNSLENLTEEAEKEMGSILIYSSKGECVKSVAGKGYIP